MGTVMKENYAGSNIAQAKLDQASERDRPWLFRTYSGHSSAAKSNELYRANLGRGPRLVMTVIIRWPGAKSARSVCRSLI